MRLATKLLAVINFWENYANPIRILLNRFIFKKKVIKVVDRQSNINCFCTLGSYRAFGEVWHDKDYDIPHVPIRKNDVVLDIGANQGFYCCYAANQGAKVYSFEPYQESYETLLKNLEINNFQDYVVAEPWAIMGWDGFVKLMCSGKLGGIMNTTQDEFVKKQGLDITGTFQVPCFTLPGVIQKFNIGNIRICKIDCEGAELDILKKMTPLYISKINSFVIECHPEAYSLNKLTDLLLSWGTHQISFAEDKYCMRNIVRAVSNIILRQTD